MLWLPAELALLVITTTITLTTRCCSSRALPFLHPRSPSDEIHAARHSAAVSRDDYGGFPRGIHEVHGLRYFQHGYRGYHDRRGYHGYHDDRCDRGDCWSAVYDVLLTFRFLFGFSLPEVLPVSSLLRRRRCFQGAKEAGEQTRLRWRSSGYRWFCGGRCGNRNFLLWRWRDVRHHEGGQAGCSGRFTPRFFFVSRQRHLFFVQFRQQIAQGWRSLRLYVRAARSSAGFPSDRSGR